MITGKLNELNLLGFDNTLDEQLTIEQIDESLWNYLVDSLHEELQLIFHDQLAENILNFLIKKQ
jgi:hypothetical protein